MRSDITSNFLFDPEVIQLNHASYGFPSKATWENSATLRRELELDPAGNLGAHVVSKLASVVDTLRAFLGLPNGHLAFTLNTTEAHETVVRSLKAERKQFTIAFQDDEYASMKSGWAETTEGAALTGVVVRKSTDTTCPLQADVVLSSVVASSTARLSQMADLQSTWVTIVDASHAPGHVDLKPAGTMPGPTAIIGSLHKWLPTMRPAGFLWLSDDWSIPIRPAIASLRDHASGPLELLSWRGTWDPVPHLTVPLAIDQWMAWKSDGLIDAGEQLADEASQAMFEIGYQEWNEPKARAPRLRSFIMADRSVDDLKALLSANRINAWVGTHGGHTVLRLAFNVYNDGGDLEGIVSALTARTRFR